MQTLSYIYMTDKSYPKMSEAKLAYWKSIPQEQRTIMRSASAKKGWAKKSKKDKRARALLMVEARRIKQKQLSTP